MEEAAAFRGVAVQTQEHHHQAEAASLDEAEAARAFQGEAEQGVLSSSAQEAEAPWAAVQTEAVALGTAVAAHQAYQHPQIAAGAEQAEAHEP